MPQLAIISADDLQRLTPPNKRSELVRGVLIVREPPGYQHGGARQRRLLAAAVAERRQGLKCGAVSRSPGGRATGRR